MSRRGRSTQTDDLTSSWVVRITRRDGTRAVLKIGAPHMEAAHEIHGLRFWNGNGMVRLINADVERHTMLLEACEPGTSLRELPEDEQDVVIAGLLRRLWRKPKPPHPFRPLAEMIAHWSTETLDSASH